MGCSLELEDSEKSMSESGKGSQASRGSNAAIETAARAVLCRGAPISRALREDNVMRKCIFPLGCVCVCAHVSSCVSVLACVQVHMYVCACM